MGLLKFIKSNISNILFATAALIIFLSVDARTILIQGLMSTGLYNAKAPSGNQTKNKSIPYDLSFKSENSDILNLAENKGKVYFINFWATWCPPCRAEMPSINSLKSKISHKDKVNFIMVDVDNKMTSSVNFMTKHNYQLKVYSTVSAIPENIFSGTLPTTLILGPNGDIVYQHSGMADYDTKEMLNFINTISR